MKLSTKWLEQFTSLDDITPEEVASLLSMGAFEVESIQKIGPKLKGPIVVGKILDIQKHPNADRLSLTKITIDGSNELPIVCGAKNIKVGQKVPVSLEGACVINRQDSSELAIKRTKIRGIESFGMLCSPGELGLVTNDTDGILILEEAAKLGENVIDYLALGTDTILEVASRSNRGDALSVYGLSREISGLIHKKLKEITFKEPKIANLTRNIKSLIEHSKDTYIFYTVTIENVKVGESPIWLKRLLESIGTRSINNVVDVTNYINFTFGQPMHAYDRAKLNGNSLTSRNAKKGEKIVTIDGKERELKDGVLVIADESKPLCIAGIMGGLDSEVTESTKDIVLEAAVFSHLKVRRGSRALGLSSEASKRFERGVDSSFTYKALLKAIELIGELASQNITELKIGKIYQAGEPTSKEIKILLSLNQVKRVLGIELEAKKIMVLLESLQFKCKLTKDNNIEVEVPSYRSNDVTRPIDLIEEIARLYGYDHIAQEPPAATIATRKLVSSREKVKDYFLSSGFSETYLSSLIGEQILQNKDFPFDSSKEITVVNPLSKEHSTLRQSLIGGLLQALQLNQYHQSSTVRLFEIGKSYFVDNDKKSNEKETAVKERLKLGGVVTGLEKNWFLNKNFSEDILKNPFEFLFFTTKGILEGFFSKYNLEVDFTNTNKNFLHPNFALKIEHNKEDIGFFGCLHPKSEKRLDLLGPVMIFEISLELLLQHLCKTRNFEKIPAFPYLERDITVDLDKQYSSKLVASEIKKVMSPFASGVRLINIYEPGSGNTSLTYRIRMQGFEQTLTSIQVENEVTKIKNHLSACFNAKFRV